jgi:RimJ/RimL family protein N-acetyltransferase
MSAFLSDGVVNLRPVTPDECELVRQWRNAPDVLPMLRTKVPLTVEQQQAFYRDVIANPDSNHRYYALVHESLFIGMGGLTYLDRVPGEAEISLILGPEFRRAGLGRAAVLALRAEALRVGLAWIIGECYETNPARDFWVKVTSRLDGSIRYLPGRFFFRWRVA